MKNKYRICISSPPDRDNLIAEIFFGDNQLAEINQEKGLFEIEFYPRSDGKLWQIDLFSVINALNEAKVKLKEK
ncbi:MAG: hypothetical protein WAM28_02985 [Chlamydiales bacterium]